MASNVVPPDKDNLSSLFLSDTFYTWFNKTNDLITKVNPIEVYSITASADPVADGITLSDDGNGNFTIGYVLGATIPGDHEFLGDIAFAAGISGNLVNTYNGLTGAVVGVSTISGTGPIGDSGNVPGVVLQINGVTATTGGAMTLDGAAIPNTAGSLTGPAGYILTAGLTSNQGTGPFVNPVVLFTGAVSGGQTAFRIKPGADNQIVVNTIVADSNSTMTIDSENKDNAIFVRNDPADGADILMETAGLIASQNEMFFQSDSTNSLSSALRYGFREGAGNKDDGNLLLQINSDASFDFTSKFKVNGNSAILLGGTDFGESGHFLQTKGETATPVYTQVDDKVRGYAVPVTYASPTSLSSAITSIGPSNNGTEYDSNNGSSVVLVTNLTVPSNNSTGGSRPGKAVVTVSGWINAKGVFGDYVYIGLYTSDEQGFASTASSGGSSPFSLTVPFQHNDVLNLLLNFDSADAEASVAINQILVH